MLKTLQPPLRGLLAVALLLAAAPLSSADYDSDLADSLVKKCIRNSDDNDAEDIYSIIRKALESHTGEGSDLVKNVMKRLRNNRGKLDNDVSNKDLDRVESQLKKWLKKHRRHDDGNVSPPESNTTAH